MFCKNKNFGPIKIKSMKAPDELLKEFIQDPECPIKYDKEYDKYTIEYGSLDNPKGKHNISMYYCPITGAKLRTWKPNKHFTKPTDKDIKTLFALVRKLSTLKDIESKLGKPDKTYQDVGDDKTQYVYSNLSDVAELWIHETKEGKLYFTAGGKRIKEDNKVLTPIRPPAVKQKSTLRR